MNIPARERLNAVFFIIAGVAAIGAAYAARAAMPFAYPDISQVFWIALLFVVPLALIAFGALGLERHWFMRLHVRAGMALSILQWISGILGIIAIFDIVMRLTRRTSWMIESISPFVIDGILVLVFILWLFASHLINEDKKERKVCEFC